jgi:DNA-binding transcriptional LysR family regulator
VDEPFVVAFVVGVTPTKWAGIWGERMPRSPLDLRPLSPADALAALTDGSAHVALLRQPIADESLSAIPLYEEGAVVVLPKDHPIEPLDSVQLADLTEFTVLDGDWVDVIELVAANVGVAIMPQSVARVLSRRDLVARPVTDAPSTSIALVWVTARTSPRIEEFIGIVRGRTANSSRGAAQPADRPPERKAAGASKRRIRGR